MRNLLLAPVLASLAIATVRPADACGPYVREPTVFRLTSHHVPAHDFRSRTTRSFALMGSIEHADKLPWHQLAPGTYDYARIADAPALEQAMAITLVGPGGTRVVSSKRRVFLDQTFVRNAPAAALEIEVGRGEFEIALAGRETTAQWIALDHASTTATDLAWVKARGITPLDPQYIHVGKLAGTEFETVSVLSKQGGMVTFVRSGNDVHAQFEGSAIGALKLKGERFVLAASADGTVTSIWI